MLLLHLSDIHFRKGEVDTAMDPNAHLRNEILRDAETQCRKIGAAPDAVLISGDLAFAGDAAEYTFALKWLEQLCQRCGAKLSSVFVSPGNHDVVRSIASRTLIQAVHNDIKNTEALALDAKLQRTLMDDETGPLLYDALRPYNEFAAQFLCDLLPPERTIARRELILNDGSILRLFGLNSAFVSSAADKPRNLFVDPACFQILREYGVVNLVMCHHPYSWLRQGDALRDFHNEVAKIHLFGHEHTNRIEPGRDWMRIAASAAHPDRTETGWEPGYNLIELKVLGTGAERNLEITAHVRVWQQRPGEFRAKTDGGADAFSLTTKLEAWTATEPIGATMAVSDDRQGGGGGDAKGSIVAEAVRSDPMETLREIGVRFYRLSFSKRSEIAGRLNLLEEQDMSQPDFERFRRVFLRAHEQGKLEELARAVSESEAK